MINPTEFQKSINQELQIVKDRVRNLIGSANWGAEGQYKEAILKKIISNYLPMNLSVATGFIIKEGTIYDDSRNFLISKQIDILIYDNSFPVIFKEGEFVIVIESSVKGIIEVKSKIYGGKSNNNSLYKICEKFNDLSKFPLINDSTRTVFKGVFGFDSATINEPLLEECMKLSNGMINHISLSKSKFIKYWEDGNNLNPPVICDAAFYNLYEMDDLSHAYFISNLIHLTSDKNLADRYWISFPIGGTKELRRTKTICL